MKEHQFMHELKPEADTRLCHYGGRVTHPIGKQDIEGFVAISSCSSTEGFTGVFHAKDIGYYGIAPAHHHLSGKTLAYHHKKLLKAHARTSDRPSRKHMHILYKVKNVFWHQKYFSWMPKETDLLNCAILSA